MAAIGGARTNRPMDVAADLFAKLNGRSSAAGGAPSASTPIPNSTASVKPGAAGNEGVRRGSRVPRRSGVPPTTNSAARDMVAVAAAVPPAHRVELPAGRRGRHRVRSPRRQARARRSCQINSGRPSVVDLEFHRAGEHARASTAVLDERRPTAAGPPGHQAGINPSLGGPMAKNTGASRGDGRRLIIAVSRLGSGSDSRSHPVPRQQ